MQCALSAVGLKEIVSPDRGELLPEESSIKIPGETAWIGRRSKRSFTWTIATRKICFCMAAKRISPVDHGFI